MTSAPTTTAPHRFCIVNCYPAASRERFDLLDVGHPHDMFKDFLAREAPNATTEIVYVADPDFALPPGTSIDDFDGFIWTGSDLTVYHTDDPRVASQISFAALLMEHGAASWGSCWGIQMASLVSGGEVAVNPRGREWGIARNITLTEAARTVADAGRQARRIRRLHHASGRSHPLAGRHTLARNERPHARSSGRLRER